LPPPDAAARDERVGGSPRPTHEDNSVTRTVNSQFTFLDRMRAQRIPVRRVVEVAGDSASWIVAVVVATTLREFSVAHVDWAGVALYSALCVVLQIAIGALLGLYRGWYLQGSFESVGALVRSASLVTALAFGVDLIVEDRLVPLGSSLGAGWAALVMMGGLRYLWRLDTERRRRPDAARCQRVIVFGAGEGGTRALRALLTDPDGTYLPVALLDDDPRKRHLTIQGVRVVGNREAMVRAAQDHQAEVLLIAVPSGDSRLMGDLVDLAAVARLQVKTLPSAREMFGTEVAVDDIRRPTPADLLGRHRVDTDLDTIADYLTGKVVLVTGAGGSIGSELCRQLTRYAPAELIMLDRDESALHAVQLSLDGRALLDSPSLVLADIRDRNRMRELFVERRPDVVFHAAALKHLPLLEGHPVEGLKSNVWGTLSVLDAAEAAGVDRFVNISTDKAADPSSVLGYTKRVAEGLTAHRSRHATGTYLSVRFGNVLGSRGSVLTAFTAQVEAGGPVTVTDPNVTRFFMTVEEAVELVIQAGAIGRPGEALVLDMGEPVRIADVARRLAAQAPRPVEIVYTGLRAGEKLHEVLFGKGEFDERPIHELISHVRVPALDPVLVRDIDPLQGSVRIRDLLAGLCDAMHDGAVEVLLRSSDAA
jgi:FlaA1/EpsC-like NDP-sugar epimerase